MQQMIIGHVREQPGISQDGLARRMNDHRPQPVVSIRSEPHGFHRLKAVVSSRMKVSNLGHIYYHIRNLMAAGAVRLEKDGKQTHCYINGFEGSGS